MRLKFLLALAVYASMAPPSAFAAEQYPKRPIRLVVPTGAGGQTDILARLIAENIKLGERMIVDNRTGASGIIGSDIVAKAAPDGYTLLMAFPSHVVNLNLFKKLPYDTLRDFAPITTGSSVVLILLVNASSAAKSVRELVALARERPGQLNYGSVGKGSLTQLSAELFKSLAGIDVTNVSYKAVPLIQAALLSQEIQFSFGTPITTLMHVRAGKLRVLAASTRTRLSILPDVPTVAEAGVPGYEAVGWNGIVAPAKTPRAVIDRLHDEIVKVLRMPEVIERLAAQGVEPASSTPEEFGAIIRADIDKWGKVIRNAGIQPD